MRRHIANAVVILATVCTCALLVFLTAAVTSGPFSGTARVGYFAVYLSSAAVCLLAGLGSHGGPIRWHWLAPAIASIPLAIIAGQWNITLSDFIALLFYPLAIVTVVKSTSPPSRRSVTPRSLDILAGIAAIATILLYLLFMGIELPSLYRFLAPGAAVLLAVPAVMQRVTPRERPADVSIHLLFAGLLLAAFADVTPFGWSISAFAWASAVWLIAVAAAVAYLAPPLPTLRGNGVVALPTGWWPVAGVAAVYVLIALQLHRIEPADVRLLATGGTLLTALILARQFVALRDNDELVGARELQDARLRELVRHSTDAFVILGGNDRIIYYSPALAQLSLRADGDYQDRPMTEVLAINEKAALEAALDYISREPGRSHRMNLSIRLAGDLTRHVEVIATNRREEPIAGIVLNIRDISERVQFERLLARQDKMDAVSRMAAGVAHEFNNILTIIMGHVDLLSGDPNQRLESAHGLDQIKHAAVRAADVTRSLLGVSRKRAASTSAADINVVIGRVEAMLRSGIGPEYKIEVLATTTGWSARADSDDLEHALLNLALNARDAMPQGGTITIATKNVNAEDLPAGTPLPRHDFVRLTVHDTGVGMPDEVLSHVFEPFFSTKPEGQGTGLGLPMVYSAVRRSGGFIDVASTVGQGSTFTIWLPRA